MAEAAKDRDKPFLERQARNSRREMDVDVFGEKQGLTRAPTSHRRQTGYDLYRSGGETGS